MGINVRDFLKQRRDRAVGSIMGYIEREIYPSLPNREDRDDLRFEIIAAINSYHDSVLDLMKSDDSLRNEEVLRLLQTIESRTRERR